MEILLKVKNVLIFYNRILQEQLEQKKWLTNRIYYQGDCFLDIDSFEKLVYLLKKYDNPSVDDLLRTIYEYANINTEKYRKLIDTSTNSPYNEGVMLWRINESWDIIEIDQNNVEGNQLPEFSNTSLIEYENHDFLSLCMKTDLLLKSWFPKQEPEQIQSTYSQQSLSKINYGFLSEAFVSQEKYERVMNILVQQRFCKQKSFRWTKGKSELIGFLKHLHEMEYLSRVLSINEMITISKSTFGVDLKERTCNTISEKVTLPVIPLASSY